MLQFNQQFIRDYLKPLIQEVLTDMSTCQANKEPIYLINIVERRQLSAKDRQNFERDYFLGGEQPANRPFTNPDEAKYREYFINELVKHVNTLTDLSGESGMKESLLPDPESGRTFGSHQALTLNLNNLAVTMARNFEKTRIREKLEEKGELNNEQKGRLQNGEMKLVEIDGEEQVKTEEEIIEMVQKEPEKQIIPMVEPNLDDTMAALPLDDTGDEQPAPPESKPVKVAAVQKDFDNSKIASIRELLLQSGLEVVGELRKENGNVVGTVRDVEGQELKVTVDTTKPNYKADKYVFEFLESGPHADLRGKEIPVSQNDLEDTFKQEEGQRKAAAAVWKEHDARGQMAREKYTPPPTEQPPVTLPGTKLPERPATDVDLGLMVKPKGRALPGAAVEGKTEGQIPTTTKVTVTGAPVTGKPAAKKAHIKEAVEESKIKGPTAMAAKGPTVMEQKEKLAQKEKVGEEERPQGPAEAPGAAPAPGIQARRPQQKRGLSWMAKLALGTGGGAFGLIGGGAWYTATAQSYSVEIAYRVVLTCLGIDCPA